jgi:PEGA domain
MPGEHLIVVRQDGYKDFAERVVVQPKEKQVVQVAMSKDPAAGNPPAVTAEVKLSVSPDRAGVFVDGLFVGHVGEFGGVGKALLLAPGTHKITIFLSGYQTFETEINLAANQKFQLKTDLVKTAAPQPTPLSDQ